MNPGCPICQSRFGFIRELDASNKLAYKPYCPTCKKSFDADELTKLGFKFREPLLKVGER